MHITAFYVIAEVSGHLHYMGMPAMCWRSEAVMQQSNAVIGVVDASGNGIEPPSTNSANNFCGPGDVPSSNPATPPAIGYDQLTWKPNFIVYGNIGGILGTPGTTPRQALFRSFSAYTVTQAAYYADGRAIMLANPIGPPINDTNTWTNSIVNPAYAMLGFDGFPVAYHAGGSMCLSGSVATIAGGNDNRLDNSLVMVYWRSDETQPWKALDSFAIVGDGDFTGVCTGVAAQAMTGMISSPNMLPNSLVAQGTIIVVGIPEPCFAFLLPLLLIKRTTCSHRQASRP